MLISIRPMFISIVKFNIFYLFFTGPNPSIPTEDLFMLGTPRLLDNGYIIYPQRGTVLPPCPEGYRRQSERGTGAWIFVPLWKLCEFRTKVLRRREDCNCEIIVHICGHALYQGSELTAEQCEACKLCPKS
jgi:hypothetical protein